MTHAKPPTVEPVPVGRRSMLTGLATALPAIALAQDVPLTTSMPPALVPPPTAASGAQVCQFLNAGEKRALDALTGRIIPADDLGPGAVEADVVVFLDRQLAGAWGAGAHFYRTGPFAAGTPQQGYQLPLTPAELFREGIARMDQAATTLHGRPFADCPPDTQEAMMTAMHEGKLDMGPIPSDLFFNAVLDATMEGFFSDPLYGGNKNMVGWKLVGFPGSYASYAQEIERHGLDWRRPPVPMSADQDLDMMPGITDAICVTR